MSRAKKKKKPKKPQFSFAADAALIDRLGRELVARQETALTELVKNGYDADATKVDVVLRTDRSGEPALEVVDDGSGMTRDQLLSGFLRLASDSKVQEPRSPLYGRQRAGRKGIGRFSAQRLGEKLVLTTATRGATTGLKLTVDWTKFKAGRDLEQIGVSVQTIEAKRHGTTIHVGGLRDSWNDAEITRCWTSLLALQQPFPVAPVEEEPSADPGFQVQFLRRNEVFEDEYVVADLQTEIIDHLHATIELTVDARGNARWRLSKNRYGEVTDWAPVNHTDRDNPQPPAYEHLHDVAMKAHYVILSPKELPRLVFSRVRDVLADHGGIRLYRNGFRVVPYGDPDNDWLRLDELYAKRGFLAPVANRNFFGIVEVRDPEGKLFEEHTSREGLIENVAFNELKGLASSVLVTAVGKISEARGRKTSAGSASKPRPQETSAPASSPATELAEAVREAKEAVEQAEQDPESGAARVAADKVAVAATMAEAVRVQLADEAANLRFLATLGMTTAEFSHESGLTFEAFRVDFENVFEAAARAFPGDQELKGHAERAQGMLARLDTLTAYLNGLAAARAARGMRPISLRKAVQEFKKGIRLQARTLSVDLDIQIPDYDPLFTKPMHEAEIASVLLNFYTNALKALKRGGKQRQILVVAERHADRQNVAIRFCDTGDGVPAAIRDRIFDAFFTTRVAPPAGASDVEHASGVGLGLWIVRQIATNAGGSVGLAQAPVDFTTCFELVLPAEDEG